MIRFPLIHVFWALTASLFLVACDTIISPFNELAYQNATSLKAKSLAMINKSGESYSRNADDVEALLLDIDAAFEFANGLPNNQTSAEQWNRIRDPNRNFVAGYAKFWKSAGTVSAPFREEAAKGIGTAFDYIICLEVNKRDATACSEI